MSVQHFEMRVVPAGHWKRLDGTADNAARPHLFPITETGRACLRFGKVIPEGIPYPLSIVDGRELALRFTVVTAEQAAALIEHASSFSEGLLAALAKKPGDSGHIAPKS